MEHKLFNDHKNRQVRKVCGLLKMMEIMFTRKDIDKIIDIFGRCRGEILFFKEIL